MLWTQAIREGFRQGLTSKGRMARKAYWQFMPAALIPPVLFASQVNWLEVHLWHGMAKLLALFVFSSPLLNATARRLRDAGEDTGMAYVPFAPFVILWIGYHFILWAGMGTALLGGFWVIIIWVAALLVLLPLHLIALVASVIAISSVLGHCLLPSMPELNPSEAPS